jgi:hypothetical protein
MSKGSFMVRGKKNIVKNVQLRICLGVEIKKITDKESSQVIEHAELFSGSEEACAKLCGKRYVKIEPGSSNYKNMNKELKRRLGITEIDDLPKLIPNDSKILKK